MRILFVTPTAWPALGGRERLLHDLARALADGEGHHVEVVARRASDDPRPRRGAARLFEPFDDGRVRVTPLELTIGRRAALAPLAAQQGRLSSGRLNAVLAGPLARWYAAVTAPALAPAIQAADIVHAWSGGYHAAAALRAARRAGVPTVVTANLHPGQWGETPDAVATYRAADAVVGYLQPEVRRLAELGVASGRTQLIPACSSGVADADGEALRARHRITGPLVLFLGARRPYKGHDLVLAAAPAATASVPGVTFAFAGPGQPVHARPGVRVIDAGEVSDDERAAWLDAADVLCLPSAFESFGLVVLEAWSTGTPVLVSDTPALAELVRVSGGGVSVPRDAAALASALVALLEDRGERERLGAAGRAWWRASATPEAVAARHLALYRSLVATASQGPCERTPARTLP